MPQQFPNRTSRSKKAAPAGQLELPDLEFTEESLTSCDSADVISAERLKLMYGIHAPELLRPRFHAIPFQGQAVKRALQRPEDFIFTGAKSSGVQTAALMAASQFIASEKAVLFLTGNKYLVSDKAVDTVATLNIDPGMVITVTEKRSREDRLDAYAALRDGKPAFFVATPKVLYQDLRESHAGGPPALNLTRFSLIIVDKIEEARSDTALDWILRNSNSQVIGLSRQVLRGHAAGRRVSAQNILRFSDPICTEDKTHRPAYLGSEILAAQSVILNTSKTFLPIIEGDAVGTALQERYKRINNALCDEGRWPDHDELLSLRYLADKKNLGQAKSGACGLLELNFLHRALSNDSIFFFLAHCADRLIHINSLSPQEVDRYERRIFDERPENGGPRPKRPVVELYRSLAKGTVFEHLPQAPGSSHSQLLEKHFPGIEVPESATAARRKFFDCAAEEFASLAASSEGKWRVHPKDESSRSLLEEFRPRLRRGDRVLIYTEHEFQAPFLAKYLARSLPDTPEVRYITGSMTKGDTSKRLEGYGEDFTVLVSSTLAPKGAQFPKIRVFVCNSPHLDAHTVPFQQESRLPENPRYLYHIISTKKRED